MIGEKSIGGGESGSEVVGGIPSTIFTVFTNSLYSSIRILCIQCSISASLVLYVNLI